MYLRCPKILQRRNETSAWKMQKFGKIRDGRRPEVGDKGRHHTNDDALHEPKTILFSLDLIVTINGFRPNSNTLRV